MSYGSYRMIIRSVVHCVACLCLALFLGSCAWLSAAPPAVPAFASVKLGLMTPAESDTLTAQAQLGLYSATVVRGRAAAAVRQTYYTVSDDLRVQADVLLPQSVRAQYETILLTPLHDNLRLFVIPKQDYPQSSMTASLSLVRLSGQQAIFEATFVVFDSSAATSAGILWYCVTRRLVSLQTVSDATPYESVLLQDTFRELTGTALNALTQSF